jgi:hypothetical protein
VESKEVSERSGPVVTVGEIQIEPIENVVVQVQNVAGAIVGMALKTPVAVVIHTPAGSWRVDLEDVRRRHLSAPGAPRAGRPAS